MGTQPHFRNLLLQYGQPLFQRGEKPLRFTVALVVGDNLFRTKTYPLEFLNLQDAGNIVVIIVTVSQCRLA